MTDPADGPATLTDDEIETHRFDSTVAAATDDAADATDTADDTGDASDATDTGDDSGDDSGDVSDASDTGDDS
jgi:hypothetical protein